MDYEIIATLGPASGRADQWRELLAAGASAFRLNTSHLELEQLRTWLDRLEPFLSTLDPRPPLVLDLQGGKWRLGHFDRRMLAKGQTLALIHASTTVRADALPVPHADFFQAAADSSGEIVLDDARISLSVESCSTERLTAQVIKGGEIIAHKGITYTASSYRCETLSPKDTAILEQTRSLDGIRYALSYVRDAREMARYKHLCGPSAYLIAKLERRPAVDDAPGIAAVSNELWLCRGDLGAELGSRAMAEATQVFSSQIGGLPVPVMLAGQVFEHMTAHAHPTRSEVCYLYDALIKGYRGIVLSDETALGLNPAEACRAAAQFRT